MKNCPVCKLDYADDFKFCEFDGSHLTTVSLPKKRISLNSFSRARLRNLTGHFNPGVMVQIACILILSLAAFILIGKSKGAPSQPLTQAVASLNQQTEEPVFFETPPAARDFNDNTETDRNNQSERNKASENQRPDKPGVTVYKPDTTDGKSMESPTADDSKPRKPVLKRPQRTEIDLPSNKQTGAPQTDSQPQKQTDNEPSVAPQPRMPQPRSHQPSSARTSTAQPAINREADFDRSPDSENDSVSLSLVHVRTFRTELGVRYELTLNMHHQGARMIRWERLTLATHSLSGINRSETIPFYQKLGVDGSMNFTVSIEMRGRNEGDLQGRLICNAVGEDVEGKAIKASFSTRINSF